jgi:hypothetical protein
MSIGYKDVLFPNRDGPIRMLDDEGELTAAAKPGSSGELLFASLGKAIVEARGRLDNNFKRELIRLMNKSLNE